jgi:thioredoxin-like negative regulator of GroEL
MSDRQGFSAARSETVNPVTSPLKDQAALGPSDERPRLLFFYSPTSGRCRRAEGFLAQVLQRRHNHDTFRLHRITIDDRPDLAERFRIDQVPTLCIVEGKRIVSRIVAPRGCRDLEQGLGPWLK